ncbi:hypothetical protein JKP88DRAFT_326026 [Tribonema minus]|uniref:VWFA domain-containing protein n=1 Tax=Tribonema minus TaxID=303371 RepID=A0A835YR58_9STRA|nr:hypothetical protein JKP88DRAFT_326026 [Tribonema minus]
MKLPPAAALSTMFVNAQGSDVPKEFALPARSNPDLIATMAETPKEKTTLQREALIRQYVLIVDRSGSMAAPDRNGRTRWDSAGVAVENMVDTIFKYDNDHQVPLYLFDSEVTSVGELTSPSQVKQVFREYRPRGSTGLDKALHEALNTYAGTKRPNYEVVPGTTFIVLLDGSADDEEPVMRTIRYFADPANKFIANHTQIALSFVQIGDDPNAERFLNCLDETAEPDICDTKKDDILYQAGGLDRLLHDAIFD